MVKGVSRQVIVVNSPDPELFEQAIFILRDGKTPVSDEALLKEAKRLINYKQGSRAARFYGPAWAGFGALLTGAVWLLTFLL